MLVQYLQHTDVQDRLEEVDPTWSIEAVGEERTGDAVYVRARLTLKGVTRENVGEGADPKAAYSDALKRAAMLFGVGRYLYDAPTVWTDYDESRDKFRQWSSDDYEAALRRVQSRSGPAATKAPSSGVRPGLKSSNKSRPREELNRILMNLYRPYLARFPETQFGHLLQERYQVTETRLMSVEQLEDLVHHLEQRLKAAA